MRMLVWVVGVVVGVCDKVGVRVLSMGVLGQRVVEGVDVWVRRRVGRGCCKCVSELRLRGFWYGMLTIGRLHGAELSSFSHSSSR